DLGDDAYRARRTVVLGREGAVDVHERTPLDLARHTGFGVDHDRDLAFTGGEGGLGLDHAVLQVHALLQVGGGDEFLVGGGIDLRQGGDEHLRVEVPARYPHLFAAWAVDALVGVRVLGQPQAGGGLC